jgi:hypothetical protein
VRIVLDTEIYRKQAGYITKRKFAEAAGINYYQYCRWTKKILPDERPELPEYESLFKIYDVLIKRFPDLTLNNLLKRAPE